MLSKIKNTGIDEYDYPLPDERISRFPLEERDQSKLLVYRDGALSQDVFHNLASHLPAGSLMIFNETKVVHARLVFRKPSGSRIEVFCLEPVSPSNDIQLAFLQTAQSTWKCLVGNARRWKSEKLELCLTSGEEEVKLTAEKGERFEDAFRIHFSWSPENYTFASVLDILGKIPLPPYIDREAVEADNQTYQTLYARNEGSVAAPTAGLHFTQQIFDSLQQQGIETEKVTLHVGAGTFKPVSTQTIEHHHMHNEQVIIPARVIKKLLHHLPGPVTLVGTTTVRTMESLYWQGVKWLQEKPENPFMYIEQWDPYREKYNRGISTGESLECVLETLDSFHADSLQGNTSLLIAPGYNYRIPSSIVTNFHQPKSTLLLLVAAFIGPEWRNAYQYALENDFRFLSYGDSCLFFRH